MKREWKAGDLALVTITKSHGGRSGVAMLRESGCWEFADGSGGHKTRADVIANARPLIVIDPEDHDALDPVIDLIWGDRDPSNRPATWRIRELLKARIIEPPKCPAALNIKGAHFGCDQPEGHGMTHGNKSARAIWGESE